MKLNDGKKVEECTDEELNKVVGGVSISHMPPTRWKCSCGQYNEIDYTSFKNAKCEKCGQPKP